MKNDSIDLATSTQQSLKAEVEVLSDGSFESIGQSVNFEDRYQESTRETLIGLYSKRDPETGQPVEDLTAIIVRVAESVALAELKYVLSPEEIVGLNLEEALQNETVRRWAAIFVEHIGRQKFWANTPANINADRETSLKVLKYWAHGKLAGLEESEIWSLSERFSESVDNKEVFVDCADGKVHYHEREMLRLARELKGRGCLAACGVTYVQDSLEGVQEAAKIEALAAKSAMGMGLNTSSLRPWSSLISNGAAASGPDRFYEKTIAKAVEAVAQGGRRGGALIELRNSDHPDILFFIDKKRLVPRPSMAALFESMQEQLPLAPGESRYEYKRRLMKEVELRFGELYSQYSRKQEYLKNTNVTVLVMPGFMESALSNQFYQATFEGEPWMGPLFDPCKPLLNDNGQSIVNRLTKEPLFEEYSVSLERYPEALEAARSIKSAPVEITATSVRVRGHFYAPDLLDRIVDAMRDSGEPGLAFYETINASNSNQHVYDLNTCNPCGEQFLPAGPGKDGRIYMGNCNLSSAHAAHPDFWNSDGTYDFDAMRAVAKVQQRFMDNVTDVCWYPLAAQNLTARMERRNGGGFAGVAEFLSRKGVRYGEKEGLAAVRELFEQFNHASLEASIDLADERGVYPLWEGSRFFGKGLRVRNSCMTNNAPTGTLAQALETSWGVDPHNGIVFSRKVRSRFVNFVAPGFKNLMRLSGAWSEDEAWQASIMSRIRANGKSVQDIDSIPASVRHAYPIRKEIAPEKYIRHLAAIHDAARFCPEVFNAVSNTCSIDAGSRAEVVRAAVVLAWKLGVKGITFYPDGSRLSQPVEQIGPNESSGESVELLDLIGIEERRSIELSETDGHSYKLRVGTPDGGSKLHVSLNHEVGRPGQLIEVYARMGKPGAIESGLFEAVGRLSSALLQFAARFGEEERQRAESLLVRHLVDIQSGYPAFFKFTDEKKAVVIQSPCDGLAKAIQHYGKRYATRLSGFMPDIAKKDSGDELVDPDVETFKDGSKSATCSNCGSSERARVDGCDVCQGCGYSRCG